MSTKSITFRIEEDLKAEADAVLNEIGLNMSSALTMFLKQVVNHRAIPFKLEAADPFYSDYNVRKLKKRIDDYEAGLVAERDLYEDD